MIPNPPRPKGSGKDARFVQWVWDKLTGELNPIDNPNAPITRTTRGWFPTVKVPAQSPSPPPVTIYACRVSLVIAPSGANPATSTYLIASCINPNPSPVPTGFSLVNNSYGGPVALPPILRTNPAPSQGAIIWPPYALNDEILIVSADGYGLTTPLLRDNQGNPIRYVQIPDDRGWCIKTDFCSNGQFVKRWVRCSGDNALP